MNQYDVKFSYEGVAGLSNVLSTNLTSVLSAYTKAKTAADSAVSAVGGETNEIGRAVKEVISDDTQTQLDQVKSIVENLINAMTEVTKTYNQQKTDILAAINKAKESGGGGSAGPAGGSGSHSNQVSYMSGQ